LFNKQIKKASSLRNFIKISEKKFELDPGQEKIIIIDFLVREEAIPDFYLGKLIVEANGTEEEILIGIEVVTKKSLFDVRIELPKKFMWVLPGDEIYYIVEIFNLGDIKQSVDVLAEYKLLDSDGNEILREHESLAVMTKLSYVKELQIPEESLYGKYAIYIKTTYNGEVASASVLFNVGKKSIIYTTWFIIIILFLILLFVVIILIKRHNKHKKIKGVESSANKNF